MRTVNMLHAKTHLSKLVEAVETGAEPEVIIARNGKPAVKIVPLTDTNGSGIRIGLLVGKYPPMSLEEFDAPNEEIAALFEGDES